MNSPAVIQTAFPCTAPGRLHAGTEPDAGSGRWYALRVRSRHEFVTANELARKGVPYFLPAASRLRQWKDRKKTVEFPLFPGYLFVLVRTPQQFMHSLQTRGAVQYVSLEPGHPTPVPSEDIDSLKIMMNCGEEIDVFPSIRQGTAVRIKRGPLCGAVGIMEKRETRDFFLVNFELLGRSVGLKVYADDVEQA